MSNAQCIQSGSGPPPVNVLPVETLMSIGDAVIVTDTGA